MGDPTGGWAAATTEGLKALRGLGGAIAEPIREVMGMASDHLRVVRLERQLRLADRVRAMMRKGGVERLDRPIPLNTLLPLLEQASLEEDDELQDVWAQMLLNAGDGACASEVRRCFVSMLAEMTRLDVRNLAKLYEASPHGRETLWTPHLPERALWPHSEAHARKALSLDVEVSLGNLVRLGCLALGTTSSSHAPTPYFVSVTALGQAFVRACTARQS